MGIETLTGEELQIEIIIHNELKAILEKQLEVLADDSFNGLLDEYRNVSELNEAALKEWSDCVRTEFKISNEYDTEIIKLETQLKKLKSRKNESLSTVTSTKDRLSKKNESIKENLILLTNKIFHYCEINNLVVSDYLDNVEVDYDMADYLDSSLISYPDYWFRNKTLSWKVWKGYFREKGVKVVFDKSGVDDDQLVVGDTAKLLVSKCKVLIPKSLLELFVHANNRSLC